jgi:CoA-transferase family III
VSDPNAALFGLFASVAGLLSVRRGGGGAMLRGSQLEAIMSLVQLEPAGPDDGLWAATDVTVCACDGVWVAVSLPDGDTGPSADDVAARAGRSTGAELVQWLEEQGVPAAPVLDVPETSEHAVFADLAVRLTTMHPVSGPEELVAAPWRSNGQRASLRKVAPLLGESDDYVLSAVLGLDDAEVVRRRQAEPKQRTGPAPPVTGVD